MEISTKTIRMGEVFATKKAMNIETLGVGSCVVVVLHDETTGVAGMLHAMLPLDRGGTTQVLTHPDRYVERALESLLRKCITLGANVKSLKAILVGGAQMFTLYKEAGKAIGPANVEAAKEKLAEMHIPIEKEETGGNKGRNVRYNMADGTCDTSGKG